MAGKWDVREVLILADSFEQLLCSTNKATD